MRNVRRTGRSFKLRVPIFLALCAFVTGCSRNEQDPLPARLGDAPLVRRVQGAEARDIVDRMHGKGVAPLYSHIGFYGDALGSAAVLYASVYERATEATGADEKMRVRIAGAGGVFSGYGEYLVAGRTISGCDGLGQRHYFFTAGSRLYWIAAPPASAFALAQEMITRMNPGR